MTSRRQTGETAALASSRHVDSDSFEMDPIDEDTAAATSSSSSSSTTTATSTSDSTSKKARASNGTSQQPSKHSYSTVDAYGSPDSVPRAAPSLDDSVELTDMSSTDKTKKQHPSNKSIDKTLTNGGSSHATTSDSDGTVVEFVGNGNDDGDANDDANDDEQEKPKKEFRPVLRDGWYLYMLRSFHAVLLSSKLNILLIFFPFACIAYGADWGDTALFILSILPLCPLSERIAFVTDELCFYTNDTIAGLISATMGNITELLISLVALQRGELLIVQMSLIGSVLSNLLLVCGCAFLAGGVKYPTQNYSQPAVRANSGLLLLATMGLLFPVTLTVVNPDSRTTSTGAAVFEPNAIGELALSRFCSFIMLIAYCLMIFYQLKTHASLFEGAEEDDDGEEEEEPVLGLYGALVWCAVITIIIAVVSEFLVKSVEGAAEGIGIPYMFITTILLPIVGNAAEHFSAVIFAYRNKLDVSIGIVVGSATQIALFVIPFCVIVGMMIPQPLTLDFGVFPSVTLFLTVIMTCVLLDSGTSDWLKGTLMIMAYVLLSASYWAMRKPSDANNLSEAELGK